MDSEIKKITVKNKILIYKVCIRPIMIYAYPVWNNTSPTNIEKPQIIQNKCLNIILNNYSYKDNNHFLKIDECHEETNNEYIS